MNDQTGNFELLEPRSPDALIPDAPVAPWVIAAVAFFIVACVVFVLTKKRRVLETNPQSQRAAAHAVAIESFDHIGACHPRDAAVMSSLIVRKYLSVVAKDPALFETHEETLSRHDALKNFSHVARVSAHDGFARLAALKYSPMNADISSETIVLESRQLLETLHHGFQG
jgi:hypothetical protein